MSAQPIPTSWLRAVTVHLRARGDRLEFDPSGYMRWMEDFPGATELELFHDFEHMFSMTLHGCPLTMDPPAAAGETWEFWFMHRDEKAYGKILLRADGAGIAIYSAHLPTKKFLRCE